MIPVKELLNEGRKLSGLEKENIPIVCNILRKGEEFAKFCKEEILKGKMQRPGVGFREMEMLKIVEFFGIELIELDDMSKREDEVAAEEGGVEYSKRPEILGSGYYRKLYIGNSLKEQALKENLATVLLIDAIANEIGKNIYCCATRAGNLLETELWIKIFIIPMLITREGYLEHFENYFEKLGNKEEVIRMPSDFLVNELQAWGFLTPSMAVFANKVYSTVLKAEDPQFAKKWSELHGDCSDLFKINS